MTSAVDYVRALLLERLNILEVRRHRFPPGWQESPVWVNASRLILVCRGTLPYIVNQAKVELQAGDALLVPLNSHRSWQVPEDQSCELLWFRYASQSQKEPTLTTGWWDRGGATVDRRAAVEHLQSLAEFPTPRSRLELEAEAKAILTRFCVRAKPFAAAHSHQVDAGDQGDRVVNQAVLYLNKHFARPDALASMYEQVTLSVSYFRKLFRLQMGCSPQSYLTQRRMEAARYALHTSLDPIKQIANHVGYEDPLYFSKLYTRHWGHSPSTDYHRRWTADEGNKPQN